MKHVSEILWWCLPWQQLLTALSLSSLPSYRKAETESGKLVTVKNPLILPSTRPVLLPSESDSNWSHWQEVTTSYHIEGHTILQPYWSIQCQIITISVMPKCCSEKCNFFYTWWFWSQDLGEVLGKAVAVFQLVLTFIDGVFCENLGKLTYSPSHSVCYSLSFACRETKNTVCVLRVALIKIKIILLEE